MISDNLPLLNRQEEMDLFSKMASGEASELLLMLKGNEGFGKTHCINHFEGWCRENQTPTVRFDFDVTREGSRLSPKYILRKIASTIAAMHVVEPDIYKSLAC